jgi:hypothetical protein
MNLNTCPNRISKSKGKAYFSFFNFFVLAILPKCPFCIMAYTSTAVLCSNKVIHETSNSPFTISITLVFIGLVFLSFYKNYKDQRTIFAAMLSAVASIFILYSVIKDGGNPLYYSGIALLFLGIWINGSLVNILKTISNKLLLLILK